MKCVFSVLSEDSYSVVIEDKKAYIEYDDDVQSLDVSSRDCFNTLISLFSLKENPPKVSGPGCCFCIFFPVWVLYCTFCWDGI